jgi:hypothetical protein
VATLAVVEATDEGAADGAQCEHPVVEHHHEPVHRLALRRRRRILLARLQVHAGYRLETRTSVAGVGLEARTPCL